MNCSIAAALDVLESASTVLVGEIDKYVEIEVRIEDRILVIRERKESTPTAMSRSTTASSAVLMLSATTAEGAVEMGWVSDETIVH